MARQILIDPFGHAINPTALTVRQPDLAGQTIVLFDNGKLNRSWGNLYIIYDVLERALAERFASVRIVRIAIDINPPANNLVQAFEAIKAENPAGVIIAMVDHGVSHRSIELARLLEAEGTPACLVGHKPGIGLAAAVAAIQLPGLPITDIPVTNTQSSEQIAEVAAAYLNPIIDSLTLPVAALKARALADRSGREPDLQKPQANRIELTVPDAAPGFIDPDRGTEAFYDSVVKAGLGDGLPLTLPTEARVAAMLESVGRARDEVLYAGLVPSGIPVTVERLAANAVMAGCRPDYFPVVLAAFEAMAEPDYRLAQAAITSHPGGNLLMVSGPLTDTIGLNGQAGCLAPGHRANLTIGRALTLTLINVGRIRSGEADLAPLGSPAEIAYCFAENRAANPWKSFNEEHYSASETALLVHRCEGPHTVVESLSTAPELLLENMASVAATLGANNAYVPCAMVIILNPLHAANIARAGWSKADVQQFLFEQACNPAEKLAGRGTHPAPGRSTRAGDRIPIVDQPDDFIIVVAGGPGPHSAIATPWGLASPVRRLIPG